MVYGCYLGFRLCEMHTALGGYPGRSYGRGASGSIASFEMPGSDSLVRGTPCTLVGIVIELLDVDTLFEGMVIQN